MGEIYRHNTESLATWLLRIFRGADWSYSTTADIFPRAVGTGKNLEHHLPDWYGDLSLFSSKISPRVSTTVGILWALQQPIFWGLFEGSADAKRCKLVSHSS